MIFKLVLVCAAASVCCCVQQSAAVAMVEMDDHNQAIMKLDLSKALKGVQDAYMSDFDFQSLNEVRNFLSYCQEVKSEMEHASDDDLEGLAKQIKAVMAEKMIATACSLQPEALDEGYLHELDGDSYSAEEHRYLSSKRTDELAAMKKQIEANPALEIVVGGLWTKRVMALSEASLENASLNIEIFFNNILKPNGFFDFETKYAKTCDIDLIKPICKLVRRNPDEDVVAIGADLADFADAFQSGDSVKMSAAESASGVSRDVIKKNCAAMQDKAGSYLRPIVQIERYISEDFMEERDFTDKLASDKALAFYNELYKLCKIVQ